VKVALGLGSSLGDRTGHITLALRRLDASEGVHVARISRLYRTPPMRGGTARGWFLNAVAILHTTRTPHDLLTICRQLEAESGRRRARFWGDRPLDLDILLVDDRVLETSELTVPHPGIAARPFVHKPLLEVWPKAIDARSGVPWAQQERQTTPRPVDVGLVAW